MYLFPVDKSPQKWVRRRRIWCCDKCWLHLPKMRCCWLCVVVCCFELGAGRVEEVSKRYFLKFFFERKLVEMGMDIEKGKGVSGGSE